MPNVQAALINGEYNLGIDCDYMKNRQKNKWDECTVKELCAKIKGLNEKRREFKRSKISPSNSKSEKHRDYKDGLAKFSAQPEAKQKPLLPYSKECPKEKRRKMDRDHVHEAALGGSLEDLNNIKLLDYSVNRSVGSRMKGYNPEKFDGKTPKIVTNQNCNCQ